MSGIWKKTLERFVHDFIKFAKDEEFAKINKAVIEIADNLNLFGWVWQYIEELLEVVTEEKINAESLELEKEHRAEEETREKEMQKKQKPQENYGEVFSRSLCRHQ